MPDPADLVLGARVCAPPLLKRIVAVGGTSYGTSRELDVDMGGEDTKGRIGGEYSHRGPAHAALRFGREGRAAWWSQGPNSCDYEVPRHGGTRLLMPTHRRAMSCTVLEELSGSKHGHSAACLLQLCFRLQCRPAPCGRGIHRLMGPTSSISLHVSISSFEHHRSPVASCSPNNS